MQLDVTFPGLPCSILSLDAMDISGEQHLDVVRTSNLFLYAHLCLALMYAETPSSVEISFLFFSVRQ